MLLINKQHVRTSLHNAQRISILNCWCRLTTAPRPRWADSVTLLYGRGNQSSGWCLAYSPMVRSDGARTRIQSSEQGNGLQDEGQERGRMTVCATEHWPREGDCHCQGGPRGPGLRNAGQPPPRWLSERGVSPCSCWWAHLSSGGR